MPKASKTIAYRATLPDGQVATRNSPTGRTYTHCIALLCGAHGLSPSAVREGKRNGMWSPHGFAGSAELAAKEAATTVNRLRKYYRREYPGLEIEIRTEVVPAERVA